MTSEDCVRYLGVEDAPELNVELALADFDCDAEEERGRRRRSIGKARAGAPGEWRRGRVSGVSGVATGNTAKARECFKLAVERGAKDPEMMLDCAELLHDAGAPAEEAVAVLQKAVVIKPDYEHARFDLRLIALGAHKASMAYNALVHVKNVSAEQAFTFFSAEAYCYLEMKAPDEMRPKVVVPRELARDESSGIGTFDMSCGPQKPFKIVSPLTRWGV